MPIIEENQKKRDENWMRGEGRDRVKAICFLSWAWFKWSSFGALWPEFTHAH